MRHRSPLLGVFFLVCSLSSAAAGELLHESEWYEIDLSQDVPADLISPEGRTLWKLTKTRAVEMRIRSIETAGQRSGSMRVTDRFHSTGEIISESFVDFSEAGGLQRWLMPHTVERKPDGTFATDSLVLDQIGGTGDGLLRITVDVVGRGWLLLPSGPREVFLERALVSEESRDGARLNQQLGHRWVDPREGVVAEVWGPASPDGTERLSSRSAGFVNRVTAGVSGLKIYVQETDAPIFGRLNYGYDREAVCADGTSACTGDFSGQGCNPPNNLCGDRVDAMTDGAPSGQTIWELACDPLTPGQSDCQADAWDFSRNNLSQFPGMIETASTVTPIDSTETPNFNECGFTAPGATLAREDKDFATPANTIHTLSSTEREDNVMVCDDGKICSGNGDCSGIGSGTCNATSTIWLRAVARNEGLTGGLGEGESRLCHITFGGRTRTDLPLWRFPNQDADGWYMELGDNEWGHTAFDCEQTLFADAVITDTLFVKPCSGFGGKQTGQVVNEGLVTLPSGHTLEALVVRTQAEYCVYTSDGLLGCGLDLSVDNVRTVVYLWQVPILGTVARLQSNKTAPNDQDFDVLAEMDIKFGLLPPRSLEITEVSGSSVELGWDPGLITSHIDGYRIYWDTDSGAATSYAFDSDSNPGQVVFNGTSAVISGLAADTEYFFTVNSTSDFTDPSSLVTTGYESTMFPKQIPADPLPLPIEARATACVQDEVNGLLVGKSGSDIDLAWQPASGCFDHYRVLGATSPVQASNFSGVADTPLTSTTLSNPADSFFLVVSTVGSPGGAEGPLGHYGQ